jgi:GNAT superfamily N-acetyltransferase
MNRRSPQYLVWPGNLATAFTAIPEKKGQSSKRMFTGLFVSVHLWLVPLVEGGVMKHAGFILYRTALIFLRDGTPIWLRPIFPDDKAHLARAFDRLSKQSRYQRFFSLAQELSPQTLAYLTEIDYANHFALGAFALDEVDMPLVGGARYIRARDESRNAEIAVTVIDDYHHRGLGQALLRALAEVAVGNGVWRFLGSALWENRPVSHLLREAKAQIVPQGSGVFRFEVDLAVIRGEVTDKMFSAFFEPAPEAINCQ